MIVQNDKELIWVGDEMVTRDEALKLREDLTEAIRICGVCVQTHQAQIKHTGRRKTMDKNMQERGKLNVGVDTLTKLTITAPHYAIDAFAATIAQETPMEMHYWGANSVQVRDAVIEAVRSERRHLAEFARDHKV